MTEFTETIRRPFFIRLPPPGRRDTGAAFIWNSPPNRSPADSVGAQVRLP